MRVLRFFFACVFLLGIAAPVKFARADCVSPAGPEGRFDYTNAGDEHLFKYCDGTNWIPWAGQPVTGLNPPAVGGGGGGATALSGLTDVDVTGVADGNCLVYNNTAGKWEDGSCAAGGGDNLGNHTAGQNIILGTHYLSNTGGASKGLSFTGSDDASFAGALAVTGAATLSSTLAVTGDAAFDSTTLKIDAAGDKVGIGIGAPAAPLHVVGNVMIDNNTDGTNKGCIRFDGTNNKLQFSHDCTSFSDMGSGSGGGGGGAPTIQVFTANGTWTKPDGVTQIQVVVTGGGAGGGGSDSLSSSNFAGGGGGGAGGTAIKWIDVTSITSVAVTVGGGGTGGSTSGGNGTAGGTSSFGAYASATGGAAGNGGTNTVSAGTAAGGMGSSGTINLEGGSGKGSLSGNAAMPLGGNGGASYWGDGGVGATRNSTGSTSGEDASAYGSAGGGAATYLSTSGGSGGDGAGGIVVVYEYYGSGGGGSADNLGDHMATQNIVLGGHYLSGDGGDEGITVDASGNVGINKAVPTVALDIVGDILYTGYILDVSDIRLKENIQPLGTSLDRLTRLDGITYTMKGGISAHHEIGLSAQQVRQVYPDLVVTTGADGAMAVNYVGLIAPMIESIKELKAENDALRGQNDALLRRLDRIEQRLEVTEEP